MTRVRISKRTRFEVFKRDKFTCQYCGRKVPDVVLNVDHIEPVSKGGTNSLLNLITSCFECNNGKSNKKLDDNSVVAKQRNQLELLQQRREQIQLMLDWKKSLTNLDDEVTDMVVDYVNSKIKPLSLSDRGERTFSDLIKKFGVQKVLDGIDEAAIKYIKNDEHMEESVELFIKKVAGVIVVKDMPPIKQKIAYVKGIARNRFGYWNEQTGSIILNQYINALEEYGWSEEMILDDIEKEVIPLTKESKNWTFWRNSLEKWADEIKKGDAEKPTQIASDALESFAHYEHGIFDDVLSALIFVGKALQDFREKDFVHAALEKALIFVSDMEEIGNEKPELVKDNYLIDFVENSELLDFFSIPDDSENLGFLMVLEVVFYDLLKELFSDLYIVDSKYSRSEIDALLNLHRIYFEEKLKSVASLTTPTKVSSNGKSS